MEDQREYYLKKQNEMKQNLAKIIWALGTDVWPMPMPSYSDFLKTWTFGFWLLSLHRCQAMTG